MQCQTFSQIPGEHACRIKGLKRFECFVDELDRGAKPLGEIVEIAAHIAVFIDHIDDVVANKPLGGIAYGNLKLAHEVFAQSDFFRDEGV